MKILAISGSPHSGNSSQALELIVELFPALEIDILTLMDLHLETCRGYYHCVLNGEHHCPLKDDRDMILDKIRAADGIILASPAYSQMVSAPIKNFIDRLSFLYHRPEFFGKFAMSLVTFTDSWSKPASAYMNKMLTSFGFSIVPELELQFTPGTVQEVRLQHWRKEIIEATNNLIVRISRGEIDPPTLKGLIPFKVHKAISMREKKLRPADFAYYQDKGSYHYDVRIGWIKNLLAQKISQKIIGEIN